ncbi:MAG: tRNA (cytidine(34)-2'-O)-methyltransferase [Nitrospinae bacterium]|nr:tRNA (cytidine(34)-2'-O)-methyltransferase [Nitrospinota bacterium]
MFTIVLVEPDIPQNTGNIARLSAANDFNLVLTGKLGFELTDRYLKRAGLDYWEYVNIKHIPNKEDYLNSLDISKIHLFSRFAETAYTEMEAKSGDYFIFGSETGGLPEQFKKKHCNQCYKIPMKNPKVRSLNLATSVGIVMYHALYLNGT